MDWLESLDLIIPGFVSSAEFGFFLFLRPIIHRLPENFQVEVERMVIRTYGRVIPILGGISTILILAYALRLKENNLSNRAVWFAVFFFSVAVATSIWLNQPVENEIGNWNPASLPQNWKSIRKRWVVAQGLRSSLQLAGYILFCISIAAR